MTSIFIPIEDYYTTGRSVIASGAAHFPGAASADGDIKLAEMSGPPTAGRVIDIEVGSRGLFVRAEITSAPAMAKVIDGVYRGLGVVASLDANGNAIIQRVALVDHPDAATLAKRSAPGWQCLYFQKGLTVQLNKSAPSRSNERVNPYEHIEIGGPNSREADERAIELIKFAKSGAPVQAKPGHRDFINWLAARSGR
jgi:hypothetical protein